MPHNQSNNDTKKTKNKISTHSEARAALTSNGNYHLTRGVKCEKIGLLPV